MTGGRIELIIGCMFSGKTSTLLSSIRRHEIAKRKCIVFKYVKDVRYDAKQLSTHDLAKHEATPADNLADVDHLIHSYDCIGIDEAQFFKNLVDYCDKWADMGKIVIVSGLDGTFQRKPFGDILQLIPRAEHVLKLSAVCQVCGEDASYSKRIIESDDLEVIGGSDKYIAVCRACF